MPPSTFILLTAWYLGLATDALVKVWSKVSATSASLAWAFCCTKAFCLASVDCISEMRDRSHGSARKFSHSPIPTQRSLRTTLRVQLYYMPIYSMAACCEVTSSYATHACYFYSTLTKLMRGHYMGGCIYQLPSLILHKNKHVVSDQTYNCPHNI